MSRQKTFTLAAAALTGILFFSKAAFAFTDLPEINRYYPAVEYLRAVGIIGGYDDNTFRPDNPVNRAEFLKLVLLSSDIKTDNYVKTPFPDTDNNAWYAPYVRKAYAEGWITGYPDGTFKPEQTINKVEALKIIGEVQAWDLSEKIDTPPFADIKASAWFAPYVSYAKEKNFLEETTSNYIPEAHFSRARISELLFRSFITRESGSEYYTFNLINRYPAESFAITQIPEPEEEEPVDRNFTPVTFKTHPADFFENISLEESFPNNFYLNEIYVMKGRVLDGEYDTAFVFLSQNGDQTFEFTADVKNGEFEIPIVFTRSGNYKMGLIPGYEGESVVADISVLPDLPEPSSENRNPDSPSELKISYKNGRTTVSFKNEPDDIIKITFSQDSRSKEFITRQDTASISPSYAYFKYFTPGKTAVTAVRADTNETFPLEIENGWSSPVSISFNAVTHQYRAYEENLISISSLPETLETVTSIGFGGMTDTDILAQTAITKPDGFVDMVDITSSAPFADYYGSDYLPAGNSFSFSYKPENSGTYSVEINNIDGSAVLNYPVYVANGLPLIPNYFDLYEAEEDPAPFNLQTEIQKQLDLINTERIRFGLNPVYADSDLDYLAQLHSDDMVRRNFFGHINPDGKTPNDRRIELGIPTPVGENLAIAPTSEYTVYGLMQSGVHRKNILDPKWTKVGIGITLDNTGSMYTSQEFSTEKITSTDLPEIKNTILERVNAERTSAGLSLFTVDGSLETPAEIWSDKMTGEDFFDFVSPTGETLSNTVRTYVPTKMVQALILEGSGVESIIGEILESEEIADPVWRKIGIGVNADSSGILKATVLFTTL